MPRKRDNEIRDEVLSYEDENATRDRAVHTEPMKATLGDKLGAADSLRDSLVDEASAESTVKARARLVRSLQALEHTLRASAHEVGDALKASTSCAVAWLRAEARRLRPGVAAQPAKV